MDRRTLLKSLVLLQSVAWTGCREEISFLDEQKVFFEYTASNSAWLKQHGGFMIDAEGRVLRYNNPSGWISADSNLSRQQMEENLSKTTDTGKMILGSDLEKYKGLATKINANKLSEKKEVGNDQGGMAFYTYRYHDKKSIYIPILLSQYGDIRISSEDKAAIEITAWLKDLISKGY